MLKLGGVIAGIMLTIGTAPAGAFQTSEKVSLDQLAWLAGSWEAGAESTGGGPQVEEHWTRPAGQTMIGMSRTVDGNRTVSFEFVRIEARADGVYYVAQPKGRPPVDFRLARISSNEVVFENPGHNDHLQHIIYKRDSADAVSARIEGANNGQPFSEDYHYRRMKNR